MKHSRDITIIIESTRAHKLIHNLPYDEYTNISTDKQGYSIFQKFSREQMEEIAIKITMNKVPSNIL